MEIGQIEVFHEERRKGHCTQFLNEWEAAARELNRAVYVECVHSNILEQILADRGYVPEDSEQNTGLNWWLFD